MDDLGKQICRCIAGACDETCRHYDAEKSCCVGYEEVVQQAEKVFSEYEGYKDLEEQNRLIKLPCKSGQKVYLLRKDIKTVIDGEITSIIIAEFASDMKIFIIDDNRYTRISFDKIGDIVFFTREEAEAALKELRRGKHERAGKDLDSG